jgi:phenylpropionate dioxygenase-like ring-hydroxylating dioxygenase large terminal subunit
MQGHSGIGTMRLGNRPDLRRIGIDPDFWYPLALSKQLKPSSTLAATFAGEPIVLVRTSSGAIFALENRCAHRQMPLHMGVVDKERLRCCYHAWTYDAAGKVVGVPYLPKGRSVPRGIRAYPCREAYGLIFVFPGDREKADRIPLPDVPTWSSPTYKTMYYSRQVNCHYSFMHENLMDMNHQFLHRRLLGSLKPVLLAKREGDAWVEAEYKFERTGGKPRFGGGLMLGREEPDRTVRHFDIMKVRTDYPYQTLTLRRPSSDEPALHLWTAYVPSDKDQRVTQSFGLLAVKKPKIPWLITFLQPAMRYFTERVFSEDRMAVEAEQRAYDLQQADWNQEVFPVILDLRALLIRHGVPLNNPTEQHTEMPNETAAAGASSGRIDANEGGSRRPESR